jgi:hypothetical protein
MPGFRQDRQWADAMGKVIQDAGGQLERFPTMEALSAHLAGQYQQYKSREATTSSGNAEHNPYYQAAQWQLFGMVRTPYFDAQPTAISGRYDSYLPRVIQLTGGRPYHVMPVQLNGVNTGLMRTVFTQQGWIWQAPPSEVVPEVFQTMNTLYQATLNLKRLPASPALTEKALKNIAQIHWLFAQAMPYHRGSAGIADMLAKTLMTHLNISTPPWKNGIAPDLEALVRPFDDFVTNYSGFFETSPRG